MAQWHPIVFKKGAQVIPAVCPSCMAPAAKKVRTTHTFLNWRYTQTFNYCEPCGRQADAAPSVFFSCVVGMFVGAAAGTALAVAVFPKLPESLKGNALVGMLPGLFMLAGIVGLPWFLLRRARRNHPLRAGQAGWGPAVYYMGPPGIGFGGGARYKALRPDWLKEFARLNADQVSSS
jgi:hypothetical protein